MLIRTVALVTGVSHDLRGDRAGRQRFEQIKEQADRFWNNPKVNDVAPGSPRF